MKSAIFGGGCFWGVAHLFKKLAGVSRVVAGYCGGSTENPDYEDVCTGNTGHAEVVMVGYDPALISYEELLHYFWRLHDPTQLNRQGPDVGTQYRSVIFYADEREGEVARTMKDALEKAKKFKNPVVTEILPAATFYPAEEYHQDWYDKNPGRVCHVLRED